MNVDMNQMGYRGSVVLYAGEPLRGALTEIAAKSAPDIGKVYGFDVTTAKGSVTSLWLSRTALEAATGAPLIQDDGLYYIKPPEGIARAYVHCKGDADEKKMPKESVAEDYAQGKSGFRLGAAIKGLFRPKVHEEKKPEFSMVELPEELTIEALVDSEGRNYPNHQIGFKIAEVQQSDPMYRALSIMLNS